MIQLYTQPQCPPCEFLKNYLKNEGITYEEFNIKSDKQAMRRMMNDYDSFSTPTIIINEKAYTMHQFEEVEKLLSQLK